MNILVCGGKKEADYILSAFVQKGNHIVVINEDEDTINLLGEHYGLDVMKMDPTKIYSFEVADVNNFDMVVSLMERDADNFIVCKIAKDSFNIKKSICTVHNPNNVAIFERLGVDVAISSAYLLKQKVQGESDVDSVIRTLSLENERIAITEVSIKDTNPFIGRTIAELRLPDTGNITCIFRDPDVIIPRGNVLIEENDTVVITSSPENQKYLIDYVKFGPDEALRKQREEEAVLNERQTAEDREIRRLNEEEKFNQAVLNAKNEYVAEQEVLRQEREAEEARQREIEKAAAEKEAEERAKEEAENKERELAETRTIAIAETKESMTKTFEAKITLLNTDNQSKIDQLTKENESKLKQLNNDSQSKINQMTKEHEREIKRLNGEKQAAINSLTKEYESKIRSYESKIKEYESKIKTLETVNQRLIDAQKQDTQLQLFDMEPEDRDSRSNRKSSSNKKKTTE